MGVEHQLTFSSSSTFEYRVVSNGLFDDLDKVVVVVCLQTVLRVAVQLFLQLCSISPLLPSCFSEEGAELKDVVPCLAGAFFSVCEPYSCTQTVVLSGMGSFQCVPALFGIGQCCNRRQCPVLRRKLVICLLPPKAVDWVRPAF